MGQDNVELSLAVTKILNIKCKFNVFPGCGFYKFGKIVNYLHFVNDLINFVV